MYKNNFDEESTKAFASRMRNHIILTIISNGEGHVGGALSCTDILAVLFNSVLRLNNTDPINNDKFLLSAGHKCLALYAALIEKCLLDKDVLTTYNQLGTVLPGHPDMTKIKAIDFSTGSLGHGLCLGCGYALASRITGRNYKTYVVMGDGEQGEGSNWEAAAFAAHNNLDSLVAVIDENGLQINGRTDQVLKPSGYAERYSAFGWSVKEVDGHDVSALYDSLSTAPFVKGRPSLIVAKTVKGKGLSFLEGDVRYHHWNPNEEQKAMALTELAEKEKQLNG